MTQTAIVQRTEFKPFTPDAPNIEGVDAPTEVRYGWNPFKDIYLYSGDGTPYYYIQPVNSPYHRNIPKNQLIPFETFPKIRWEINNDVQAEPGKPAPRTPVTEVITAHQAATELLRGYAQKGYAMLKSLQGIPQKDAFRIFQIIQPLDYPLYQLVDELKFHAESRINADEPIEIDDDYILEPLRNNRERDVARNLLAEMVTAADLALDFGTKIFDETEKEMIAAFSGKKGAKSSPDPLDRYLSVELNRELPKLINKTDDISEVKDTVKYLADREVNRETQEENERLKRENAELKAAQVKPKCNFIKGNSEQCKFDALDGTERCGVHKDK